MILLADEESWKGLKLGKNLTFSKGTSIKDIEEMFFKRKVVNVCINPTDIKGIAKP